MTTPSKLGQKERGHTPGPWRTQNVGYYRKSAYYIRGMTDKGEIQTHGLGALAIIPKSTRNNFKANARLIAAAPELLAELEALTQLVFDSGFHAPGLIERMQKAEAAMEKARGPVA